LATGKEIPHFKIKLYHFILFSLLLFFYPFILYDSFSKKQAQPEESEQISPPLSFASDYSSLTKKISVTEAEDSHMVSVGDKQVPFGYNNAQWQRLPSMIQDGDELWAFASSDESWDALAGREGLALVRNGKTIYDIITCMS
jgi:hypothetical protein